MKSTLYVSVLALFLASCAGTKKFTIFTTPEGADITVNGEYVGKSETMINLEDDGEEAGEGRSAWGIEIDIEQDKTLGIVAHKSGYEVASATIRPVTSKFLSFIWTESHSRSKYIAEDSVHLTLRKLQTPASYTPRAMPPYTGGGGPTSAVVPKVPELRPMPRLD